MKKSIPSTQGKIAKDARECVQECVSEFISFITSEASDRCQAEKRKTINGEDILFAMSTLGFDNYVEPLKIYLQKYREAMKGDKQTEGEFEAIGELLGKIHCSNVKKKFVKNEIFQLPTSLPWRLTSLAIKSCLAMETLNNSEEKSVNFNKKTNNISCFN